MSTKEKITKDNIDYCLSRLAKEYRKLNGKKMRAEIVIIGGGAILTEYGFREMTYDVDAIIQASSSMKDAINKVGDELNLENGWLNSDFKMTTSYSPKLVEYSKFYKSFGYVLDVRVVTREYLVAMKLMSFREYKHDQSDIIGILAEEQQNGTPITLEEVQQAVVDLYGSWEKVSERARDVITKIINISDLTNLYDKTTIEEADNFDYLKKIEEKYTNALNSENVSEIIERKKRKSKGMSL